MFKWCPDWRLLPFLFSGMTMQAVGTAAGAMIEEVRRQFREIKGLREGKKGVKPDAARAVEISTTGSLKAMILPSILAIVSPILIGLFLKAEALGGMLAGSLFLDFYLLYLWLTLAVLGIMQKNILNSVIMTAKVQMPIKLQ